MAEISMDTLLEQKRKQLHDDMNEWMAQQEIPLAGERISFTIRIVQGNVPELNVTVKRVQPPAEQRIVRTTITDEEWSQVFLAVRGRPRQHSILEFLRNGPNQQRTRGSMYAYHMSGKPVEGGFSSGLTKQVNRTLRNAGLPFRVRTLARQEKTLGPISLVLIASPVESSVAT